MQEDLMDWDDVRSRLRGPGALISTIFHDDYTLDLPALEANVRHIVDLGIGKESGYLIAPCGDGEYVTLSPEEHRLVVETAVRASGGTVPVVAGVQSTDYRLAASLAQGARDAGAIAVMLAPPMYYPLHEDAIIDFYRRFSESVDIGIMMYEQAWRGPFVNAKITPDALGRLLEIPATVAMKHSGLFNLIDEFTILDRYHDRIAYMDTSACYAMTTAHMHGAAGWVSELATWWPEFELRYWERLEAGDYREAQLEHARLNPILEFTMAHPPQSGAISQNSILKAALDYVGLNGGVLRPPFRALDETERALLYEVLDSLSIPSTAEQVIRSQSPAS
jgi:dihydrodipicolinate synthase/N-acetylneuraminate lyase